MSVGLPAGGQGFARYKILFDTIYFLKYFFIPLREKTFFKKVFKGLIHNILKKPSFEFSFFVDLSLAR